VAENKKVKITTPDGKVYIKDNEIELDIFWDDLQKQNPNLDFSKIKIEPYQPVSNETTLNDRLLGALGMGGAGAVGGALMGGGPIGAMVGGGLGALVGGLLPPKTTGEWVTGVAGSVAGGPIGKGVGAAVSKLPGFAGPFVRGGTALAEAELGHGLQTKIDTGKAEFFDPLSPGGVMSMLAPNVGNAWKTVANASPNVTVQRMKNLFPAIREQLTNKNIVKEATENPIDTISKFAFERAKPVAKIAQQEIQKTTIKPLEDILNNLEKQKEQLQQQLQSFTANSPTGPFAKTQQYLQRNILLKQLDEVNEQLNDITINRAQAQQAALANNLALERLKKQTVGNLKDEQLNKTVEQSQEQLTKERWKQQFLEQQAEILRSPENRAVKAERLKLLENQYKQIFSTFDIDIKSLQVDKKVVDVQLNDFKRKYNTVTRNLELNKKYQQKLNVDETKLDVEKNKLKSEIAKINQEEAAFYKQQKQITGIDLKNLQNEIKSVNEKLNTLNVLPPNIKKIVQSGENVDEFLDTVRKMRPDEYSEFLKYIPPAQQKTFNESVGDAIIFDFFVKSYNPKTGQFSNMQDYLTKYGLPNVEQFYNIPGGQEKFVQLTDRLLKTVPQGSNRSMKEMLQTYLTGSALRGAAYQGLFILFGTSKFHAAATLKTAATGTAALAVATPVLLKAAMKNEKLAQDFIKFVDSGGSLTYAQVPYLATFIKNESKPVSENELTDMMNYMNELANTNQNENPPQQNSNQEVNQNSPEIDSQNPAEQQ
jgi:hypothetical protein